MRCCRWVLFKVGANSGVRSGSRGTLQVHLIFFSSERKTLNFYALHICLCAAGCAADSRRIEVLEELASLPAFEMRSVSYKCFAAFFVAILRITITQWMCGYSLYQFWAMVLAFSYVDLCVFVRCLIECSPLSLARISSTFPFRSISACHFCTVGLCFYTFFMCRCLCAIDARRYRMSGA